GRGLIICRNRITALLLLIVTAAIETGATGQQCQGVDAENPGNDQDQDNAPDANATSGTAHAAPADRNAQTTTSKWISSAGPTPIFDIARLSTTLPFHVCLSCSTGPGRIL